MLFDSWNDLLRILLVGTGAYAGLIVILRLTGKRTLSKMNAFDLVVTVALGSTLATILLDKDVSLAEGLVAFLLLCVLQLVVAFTSVRSKAFRRLIKAEPTLLYFRERFLDSTLRAERVTADEVLAGIRAQGVQSLDDVHAVVLETDGSLSVLKRSDQNGASSLQNINPG